MSNILRHYMNLVESLDDNIIKAAVEYLRDAIDWGGGAGEEIAIEFADDTGFNGDASEIDGDSPEFKEWFDAWALNRISLAYKEIARHFDGDVIHVYREISAPENWKPSPNRHPGVFWSWNRNAAEAHWGDGGHAWMLEADVHSNDIDWPATLAQNAHPDFFRECEIRVKENADITITDYYPSENRFWSRHE